jgi:nitrite reductase (cytochrome c-552)
LIAVVRGAEQIVPIHLGKLDEELGEAPGRASCIHSHASVYVPYRTVGEGDLMAGWEAMNQMPYAEAAALVEHPVSCIDCHDPATMELRVTRPGFINGIRDLKAFEGTPDYDVNEDASRQEMRTYVCGQCHVEYYFQGPEKRLVYPWQRGLRADSILAVYQDNQHRDWTHATSGAPTLKAQHPEFELYNQGIHARSGVACTDCHMPYKRVGAVKISDHWVRSPLLNVDNACQTCHTIPEDELVQRVHDIQDRTYEMRNIAIDAVLQLTGAIGEAAEADPDGATLHVARDYQRRAQFLTDFIEAENSMGFHGPQEAVRILGKAVNYARIGHAALRGETLPETGPSAAPEPTVVPARPGGAR